MDVGGHFVLFPWVANVKAGAVSAGDGPRNLTSVVWAQDPRAADCTTCLVTENGESMGEEKSIEMFLEKACEDSRIVPGVEFNVQEESLMGEGDLFLGLHLQCMDVPRLGVKSEL